MRLLIINGPNLNLLGKREVGIYGSISFEEYLAHLKTLFSTLELEYFQSNSEGDLIDKLHEVGFSYDGIILNGGAYTHTSIALMDAIGGIETPVVEVHISNIHTREPFREHSYTAKKCKGVITGLGLKGYELAIRFLMERHE